jgi:methionyl-tRNA synthetase
MAPAYDWVAKSAAALERVKNSHAAMDLGDALRAARQLVMDVDAFISFTAPFKLAKTLGADPRAKDKLAAILYNCAEAVRVASLLFAPACPTRMRALWSAWGLEVKAGTTLDEWCAFASGRHSLRPGQKISKGEALFMRADPAEAAPA